MLVSLPAVPSLRCFRVGALALLLIAAALPALAQSKEVVVNMLNQGKDGTMVFEPTYVKVNPGDTVVFRPTQVGAHNSKAVLVPAGATPWNSANDRELKVKLDKEGVYVYICEPHKMMGMAGVIQVGKPANLAAAKDEAKKQAAGFVANKDRLDKAMAQVK